MTTLWRRLATIGLPTGFALFLYWTGAAPGLTWAHHGADGGDFLAAAATNGVPHPSGYPLYMLLLRAWLQLGNLINPQLEIAYWGNRLSALCAAGAVGFTVAATVLLLPQSRLRWLWAILAGLVFSITPIVWSQALITEVYALHALLVAAMGWLVLTSKQEESVVRNVMMGALMGLGAAHHLTSILLWPALLYWRVHALPLRKWPVVVLQIVGFALLLVLGFYASLMWRIASAETPPPVAWGYPRDLSGLWWLVSGEAYRNYVFGMTLQGYVGRLASLASLLVEQFTPLGLAFAIGGFAVWDRHFPHLRAGAILWAVPVSLYAAGYSTVDSYVYLLPVVWLMSLLLGQALASGSAWLVQRLPAFSTWLPPAFAGLCIVAIAAATLWRFPTFDLRNDRAAQEFLDAAMTTLEPGSLVVSSADAPTFALWYGQWGSGELAERVPDLILVNHALYQFGWYRNLMHDHYQAYYPGENQLPPFDASFEKFLSANRLVRPVYFAEQLPVVPAAELTPVGIFWRLDPP